MAQTPCTLACDGGMIPYTPGTAVAAGQVVLLGNIPTIAPLAIAANIEGVLDYAGDRQWNVPKDTSTFTVGAPVYWNPTGSPVGGTASSGAASTSSAGAYLMGPCLAAAATGASTVRMRLRGEY